MLLLAVLPCAFPKGTIKKAPIGEDGSAKSSLQQAFTCQVVQIFSDRDYAERKTVGQLADTQDACLFKKFEYLRTPRFCFHGLSGLPSPNSAMKIAIISPFDQASA
jgi:hypothetical protein